MNLKYILMRAIRRQLPDRLFFTLMKLGAGGLADNVSESAPHSAIARWQEIFCQRGLRIAGKHLLELGSGRYARFAIHALAAGARRVTLIDLYAMPLTAPEHRALLESDCAELGLDFEDAIARVEVIHGDILSLSAPPTERRTDIVISNSVLEHLQDPSLAMKKCIDWLKPGGFTCHAIDLRDHYFLYPFEMLTFSDRVWERWLNPKGGFHLNRWRAPDYAQAVADAGFVNVTCDAFLSDEAGLKSVAPRLAGRFRNMSEEALSTLMILLYGEKPLTPQSERELS